MNDKARLYSTVKKQFANFVKNNTTFKIIHLVRTESFEPTLSFAIIS